MSYNIELLQKNTGKTIVSPEQIKTLPTKTLLKVYKTLHSYSTHGGGTCDCCGESYTTLYGNKGEMDLSIAVDENFYLYKQALKAELSTREHITKRKPSGKPNPKRNLVLLRKNIKNYKLYLLPETEIRRMYNEQAGEGFYSRNPFKGFSLTKILELVNEIKHSKENTQESV